MRTRLRRSTWAGLMLAAGLLACAAPAGAAVNLLSALPQRGRATDIRDTGSVASAAGQWTVFQSFSYRFADQKFDEGGRAVPLGFNQTVTLFNTPTSLSYGASGRLAVGATLSGINRIRNPIAVTNFAAGVSLLGQELPSGQSTRLLRTGDGGGDATINAQYRLSSASDDLGRFVSLDVTLPAVRSDPADALDVPIGQGYVGVTPSAALSLRDGVWTHFAKAGYELTAEADEKRLDGTSGRFKAGQGFNYTLGTSLQVHGGVTARAHFSGFRRGPREKDGVEQPEERFRGMELRPGLTFHGRRVNWNLETYVPISGANVLRTTGLFATVEVSF